MKKIIAFAFVMLISSFTLYAQKNYSVLWGVNGEKWDKSIIPDFTDAGYMSGREAIPEYPVSVNVMDYGGKADGITDNTVAFRSAISRCRAGGTVYIPEGRYVLSDSLQISKSGVCIRGAGEGKTVLLFTKGLEELYPRYDQGFKNQTAWSWSGAMILFCNNARQSGIEHLSIQFPGDSLWAGHNFHERGYNGIGFSTRANNDWIKSVTITNADVGIWVEGSAYHITAENWVLNFSGGRARQKVSGHHGVNIYGGHNLLQNFRIDGMFQHDLSVESATSIFNVFRKGKGTDMCIDHHNHAQRYNLFTNLDMGIGSRIYTSGGVSTPRGISYNEVYWNITSERDQKYCDQWDTPEAQSANNVCVGIKTNLPSKMPDQHGNWFETINPGQLVPQDLFEAQKHCKQL